ncbi:MAG: hypothetical protein MUO43_14220, partial [Desulfobacterales bacterium]|nr:hypothetical protein [Desulfobacterales bacterium]
ILAGPYHPAFGHLVHSEIFFEMASSIIESEGIDSCDSVEIKVHPRSISKMRGIKNFNVKTLKKRFNIKSLEIIPDLSLAEDDVTVHGSQFTVPLHV